MGGGNQAHKRKKKKKRDPRETGKYELWVNSGNQRRMPMQGIAGTGEARRRGLDKGRDREGAHGGTGSWNKKRTRLVRGKKQRGLKTIQDRK